MKRFTPYIFPLLVLAIVFFLVYRWYDMRNNQSADSSQLGEGIEIENLTDEDADSVMRGTGDFQTTPLETVEPSEDSDQEPINGTGSIRYEIADGRVRFSVSANLPEPETPYTVWVRTQDSDNLTQAFSLELGKGGYMGSAAVSEELLPLEVVVSQATERDQVMENVILRGMIEDSAEEASE